MRETTSSFLQHPNGFIAIVIGWMTARLLYTPITGLVLGPFVLLPGFVVAIFCLVLLLLQSQPWTRLLLLVGSGMIADSLVYWCIRFGMGAPLALTSLWEIPAIIGSLVTLFVVLLFYALSSIIPLDFLSLGHRNIKINRFLITILPILSIAIMRASYLFSKDIPNEERSLYIHGTEIHHAVTGTVVLLILNISAFRMRPPPGFVYNALLGISAGFILDQVLYLPLAEVSDIAYNGTLSWIGAIIGGIIFACAGFVFRQPWGTHQGRL